MCTAFVYRGEDRICGFNMDLNEGALDWKLFMDEKCFFVGLRPQIPLERLPAGMEELLPLYLPGDGPYLRLQGVNSRGSFGNQLNMLNFPEALFRVAEDSIPLYTLVDRFLTGQTGLNNIMETVREKQMVNLPAEEANIPDAAMHSLLSDREGRILILEPGCGYAEVQSRYAVMSNFSVLRLPRDLREDRYGYYGMDRYQTAFSMLEKASPDFSVEDALRVLEAVRQTGQWATRVSFVYTERENAVYYTLEHDFSHIRRHCFGGETGDGNQEGAI